MVRDAAVGAAGDASIEAGGRCSAVGGTPISPDVVNATPDHEVIVQSLVDMASQTDTLDSLARIPARVVPT